MNNGDIKSTNKLLRTIVALLLRRKEQDIPTLRQQIEILKNLGTEPKEIAEILGREGTYINTELYKLRKVKKRGKK